VTIDRCVDCKGVWLDAGDLEVLEHAHENGVTRFFNSLLGRYP
jgi:Zn-finger nucleic acid-binding protein